MLMTLVLGGVFDRHPNLRFGVIESAMYWVGPLMRRLDMWWGLGTTTMPERKLGGRYQPKYRLPEKPSFYMKRNVRITPFIVENDIAEDITHYGLEDMVCFSTDYPHVEGGKYPTESFYKKVQSLNPEFIEKFFVKNAQWIMPE
jgi:predicted TIM-barrel fold metal-dependent hydrolase